MKIEEKISNRLKELVDQHEAVLATRTTGQHHIARFSSPYDEVNDEEAYKWGLNCLHILGNVFGKDGDHYKQFNELFRHFPAYHVLGKAVGIMKAARDDYDGGYVMNLNAALTGEVFQDFVALAKRALAESNKDVASVLACAALEDALKRYAQRQGLNVDNKDMSDVVAALKARGLVSGAQKSLLDTMPKIRNYAMHANWEKIKEPDVNSVIGFVERFLITHF
jgi:hypothetical protein